MFEQLVAGVRTLVADDLGIGVKAKAASGHASSAPDAPDVTADHPRVQEIVRLAEIYGGVILSGPPGTSKSFFAAAAGAGHGGWRQAPLPVRAVPRELPVRGLHAGLHPEREGGFEYKEGPFLKLVQRCCCRRGQHSTSWSSTNYREPTWAASSARR